MSTDRVRLIDVAAAASVTKSIASRVLNEDPSLVVQPRTRMRVLNAAKQLGYRPHPGARALATARTMTLALIAPALDNPPYVTISRGAFRRASELGYLSLLAEDRDDHPVEGNIVDGGRVDGVLMGSAYTGHPLVERLAHSGVPHVFLNRSIAGSGRNVTMDVGAASRLAVDHLQGLGHQRIVHLAGPRNIEPSAVRTEAFNKAIQEAGLPVLDVVHADFTEADAYRAMPHLLRSAPTAIYTSSLGQGIGALRALADAGIRVPHDMSIVAFDDFPVAEYVVPRLTAIRMPLLELGAAAVEALVAQLEGGEPADVTVDLPGTLVIRESTGPVPA